MNIYLVSQNVNNGYDTYDAFVVYARDENEAKRIRKLDRDPYGSWVTKVSDIEVTLLGHAPNQKTSGEILGSFNAG
jgi:hypothetical protein